MNWRKTLIWDPNLIDIDYWLQYEAPGYTFTERNKWTDPYNAVNSAIVVYENEKDESLPEVPNSLKQRAIKFAKEFIHQNGWINVNILIAYLMQEWKETDV